MKKEGFDCMEMKRKAAAPINERLQRMTLEQQITYWRERSQEFFKEYGEGKSPHPEASDERVPHINV